MTDYLFYTYFEDGREYFVYKDLTFERSHKKEKDFPFLESLLRFTYLDIWPMENLFSPLGCPGCKPLLVKPRPLKAVVNVGGQHEIVLVPDQIKKLVIDRLACRGA